MERTNYDLELYAKALESMLDVAFMQEMPLGADEDPYEYAKKTIANRAYCRGRKLAYDAAVTMLRGTPSSLFHTYPDHFPDPREDSDPPLP